MLVLSRKKGETIDITVGGERIEVSVVEIRGDKVRLGVEASKSVAIHRREVQELIDGKTKASIDRLADDGEG